MVVEFLLDFVLMSIWSRALKTSHYVIVYLCESVKQDHLISASTVL
jgi:hypothetical protein